MERQEGKHEQDEKSHPIPKPSESHTGYTWKDRKGNTNRTRDHTSRNEIIRKTPVIHEKTGRETRTGREITPHVPKPSESHTGYTWTDTKGNTNRTRDHTPRI